MKIQQINTAQNTGSFGKKTTVYQINPLTEQDNTKSKTKLEAGLTALAVFGVASVCFAMANKGLNPVSGMKNSINNIKDTLGKPKDPVVKALKGKRDASAVETYKKMMYQKKLKSLQTRIAQKEFHSKPEKDLHKILENVSDLQQKVQTT